MNICGKFYRNPSIKYRDIAAGNTGVDKWTIDGWKTDRQQMDDWSTQCLSSSTVGSRGIKHLSEVKA